MNPMLESLNRSQTQPKALSQIEQLKSLSSLIQNPGGTVKATLMDQLRSHPLFSKAQQIANQFGGDWNLAFRETARQNGIDPEQITSIMRQQGLIQ